LLSNLSGYSESKLKNIKNYWLRQTPKEHIDLSQVRYIVYDGTYFHKDGCLLNLMSATDQKILSHIYVRKESFRDAYPWFVRLRQQGLTPLFITTDGERSILRAMKLVWPEAKLQRCLYHLQRQGMSSIEAILKLKPAKS
jgi:hypothetical protein